MTHLQLEQGKVATFFIRVSSDPIAREEFRVADQGQGVWFIKKTKPTTGLKALFLGRRSAGKSEQGSSSHGLQASKAPTESNIGPSSSPGNIPNTDDPDDLIEFLKSQKAEAQWMQEIFRRQLKSLEDPNLFRFHRGKVDYIDPTNELTFKRTRRNLTEIISRGKRLQDAIQVLPRSPMRLNFVLIVEVVRFLRRQAEDMDFAAEEEQRRIRELSDTTKNKEVSGPDPYMKAIVRKIERESKAEQYRQAVKVLTSG